MQSARTELRKQLEDDAETKRVAAEAAAKKAQKAAVQEAQTTLRKQLEADAEKKRKEAAQAAERAQQAAVQGAQAALLARGGRRGARLAAVWAPGRRRGRGQEAGSS